MCYLVIELARTIDEDRYREAERCNRINKAPAIRQRQPADPIQILVRWLQSLAKSGPTPSDRAANQRTLAGLS